MRGTLLALVLAIAAAMPAVAHRLTVFASVEGESLVVEAKFSTGRVPKTGVVTLFDAQDSAIGRHDLGGDGMLRLPLDPAWAEEGVKIEVEAGDGHSNYWILTPADISAGAGG